ncbi:hypothetical protein H7H48_05315 [Nitratireductor sp. B36]|uniref:putative nucleotide-diphospho-sugar transferase n=1 Tax=Nitratireductor sp. B36 TaxID=2762059 RepID=UPI001E52A8E5|nr:putative nucleotide-diphospho-sugar transferase [Nitratireductor sp. B36]MCC5778460.1 hypothetical protein [Nitratireductor sp. B36]
MRVPVVCFGTRNFAPLLHRMGATLDERFLIDYTGIDAIIDENPGGGKNIWLSKIDLLLSSIKKYEKEPFFFMLDIDIQFFPGHFEVLAQSMSEHDLVFQQETDKEGVNIGVIGLRPSKAVIQFWEEVRKRVLETGEWDQKVVNDLFAESKATRSIFSKFPRIGVLPRSIWNWSSGRIPEQLFCHHANCTSALDEKWRQMDVVEQLLGFTRPVGQQFSPVGNWTSITLNESSLQKAWFAADGSCALGENSPEAFWKVEGSSLVLFDKNRRRTGVLTRHYYDPHHNVVLLSGFHARFNHGEFWMRPALFCIYREVFKEKI